MCPTKSLRSLQLVKFQTLTKRSQPAETIRGTDWEGEKRTQDTHSVWPSASPLMVYLHSPRVFQRRMVQSREPIDNQKGEIKENVRYRRIARSQRAQYISFCCSLIGRTRHNLSVIHREGDGKDILVVSNKATCGFARGDIPQSEFGIPAGRQGKGSIRRNDNIGTKVRVSTQRATSITIGIVVTTRTRMR